MTAAKKSGGLIWPISIFVVYMMFALLLVGKVISSQQNDVELVRKDYYEKGVEYQKQIDRIERTKQLAFKPELKLNANGQSARLIFPEAIRSGGVEGTIEFFRPSDVNLDFEFPIQLDANGAQPLDLTNRKSGFWRVKLNWTHQNLSYYQEMALNLPN